MDPGPDNSTSDCKQSNISLPVVDYLQGIITAIIIIGSICINSIVIYLVARFKKLHQRPFYLALQLVVLNLVYSVFYLPTVVVSYIARRWILGHIVCLIFGSTAGAFFTVYYFVVLVLTIDRFLTIFAPFFYTKHGNKMAVGMSISVWLLGLYRVVSAIALNCITYIPFTKLCSYTSCSIACKLNGLVFVGLLILGGVATPLVLYLLMYLRGRALDKKVMTDEEFKKRQFNNKVIKTYLLIFVIIGCVGTTNLVLFLWFVLSSTITLGHYIVLTLVGHTLSSSVTITGPVVILRNRDVRDAWKERK